mgnify:CR=1 FL=1|nr:MAG TPA_asm: hypothetical protein [Caudoviricetes sp.]
MEDYLAAIHDLIFGDEAWRNRVEAACFIVGVETNMNVYAKVSYELKDGLRRNTETNQIDVSTIKDDEILAVVQKLKQPAQPVELQPEPEAPTIEELLPVLEPATLEPTEEVTHAREI